MTAQDFYQDPVARARTNPWAVAALICAIVGFVAGPAEILAIIFGHIARSQIRRTGENGDGMALAGLIIGYITVVLGILLVIAFFLLLMPAFTSGSAGSSSSVSVNTP